MRRLFTYDHPWPLPGALALFAALFLYAGSAHSVRAQTGAFSYQGQLANAGAFVNGNYDFEFRLFDAAVGGALLNGLLKNNVPVTNGLFTVPLDFGVGVFNGAPRFLEISVKPSGGGAVLLMPRQPMLSVPYAIKSLNAAQADIASNATQLGGVAANQFVQNGDPRLSGNAILNQTAVQAGANFNVSGSGTANLFNALLGYDLGGSRFISGPGNNNTFIGLNTGKSNTTGAFGTFVGFGAGASNTTGFGNTFIGDNSGAGNTTGSTNVYVGGSTGASNLTGFGNSFFGDRTGQMTTGNNNAFFGVRAGMNNTATANAFFGAEAGMANTTGDSNTFIGSFAGSSNTTGKYNTFSGFHAGFANTTGANNSFFGLDAGFSNTDGFGNSFFGLNAGRANTTGKVNVFLGSGAGENNITGDGNLFLGYTAGNNNKTGVNNTFVGTDAGHFITTGNSNTLLGWNTLVVEGLSFATAIGAGSTVNASNTVVLGRAADAVQIPGSLTVAGKVSGNGSGLTNLDPTKLTAGTAAISITGTAATATNATKLGGVAANQYVLTTDPRLAGGGGGSIRETESSNLYAGTGAGINTATVSGGTGFEGRYNTFVGYEAGKANTTAFENTFFGYHAGTANTTGLFNTIFGSYAGGKTSTGNNNTFFGASAGFVNTIGKDNSFFGSGSGIGNTTGIWNTFVGSASGEQNSTGERNTFMGVNAGGSNITGNYNTAIGVNDGYLNESGQDNIMIGRDTGYFNTGSDNTFIGNQVGQTNTTGGSNTLLGAGTEVGAASLSRATAIGVGAKVTQSDSLVLGSLAGGPSPATKVGIGTTAPKTTLEVTGGKILVGSPGQGIILRSPNGSVCRELTIDDSGAMKLNAVACP